jgi:hypothetical protein
VTVVGAAVQVGRAQVMAYRVAALGLAERSKELPAKLAVLDLGVQEYTPGSVRVALAARTSGELSDDRLIMVWAARGAPHLHRRTELAALMKALWPVSDADAAARIKSGQIPDAGKLGVAAFTATAEAFREVVTKSMPRGVVSAEVSARVPRELTYECRSCEARHIAGNVWQHSGLAGAIEVEARGKDATLGPIKKLPGPPAKNAGIDGLIATYLRLLGPATPIEVAKYFGSSTAEMKKVWPAGLTEVTVDGRKAWLPDGSLAQLRAAGPVPGVRLIPPMDALLQARDRDVLVPDKAGQKEVWRTLGNPGALLVDGEIAGVWRAKMAGRKRVDLAVTSFGTLTAKIRKAVEAEAAEVARAREVLDAGVSYTRAEVRELPDRGKDFGALVAVAARPAADHQGDHDHHCPGGGYRCGDPPADDRQDQGCRPDHAGGQDQGDRDPLADLAARLHAGAELGIVAQELSFQQGEPPVVLFAQHSPHLPLEARTLGVPDKSAPIGIQPSRSMPLLPVGCKVDTLPRAYLPTGLSRRCPDWSGGVPAARP